MTDRIFRTVRSASRAKVSSLLAAVMLLSCLIASSVPQLHAQSAPAKPHRKVLVMFDPEYPTIMKNGHFDGQVRLDATVAANGTVSKVEVKGGNPILAQCASQAVVRWKYAPAPAQTTEEVIFNFNANSR